MAMNGKPGNVAYYEYNRLLISIPSSQPTGVSVPALGISWRFFPLGQSILMADLIIHDRSTGGTHGSLPLG